ncbi:MAG: hypothetical protein ORN54_00335 [Cyclobacteriaceae bacterium]|nr:hypothetical protein [Cyclobacteriaceae bacterium]
MNRTQRNIKNYISKRFPNSNTRISRKKGLRAWFYVDNDLEKKVFADSDYDALLQIRIDSVTCSFDENESSHYFQRLAANAIAIEMNNLVRDYISQMTNSEGKHIRLVSNGEWHVYGSPYGDRESFWYLYGQSTEDVIARIWEQNYYRISDFCEERDCEYGQIIDILNRISIFRWGRLAIRN